MRKVELLPTRDCEAGYRPGADINLKVRTRGFKSVCKGWDTTHTFNVTVSTKTSQTLMQSLVFALTLPIPMHESDPLHWVARQGHKIYPHVVSVLHKQLFTLNAYMNTLRKKKTFQLKTHALDVQVTIQMGIHQTNAVSTKDCWILALCSRDGQVHF